MATRLTNNDHGAASELIEATFNYLLMNPDPDITSREDALVSNYCDRASDAVKRASTDLGIIATREMHYGHIITVFSDERAEPSPTDPILCLTWGQFLPEEQKSELRKNGAQPYFGERRGIKDLVGASHLRRHINYTMGYSPWSVIVRFERDLQTSEHTVVYGSKRYQSRLRTLMAAGWEAAYYIPFEVKDPTT